MSCKYDSLSLELKENENNDRVRYQKKRRKLCNKYLLQIQLRVNFIYILFALRISFEICYFITSFLNQKHVYYNNLDYLSMITAAVVRSWRTLCLFWHPFFFAFYYNYFLSLPISPLLVFSMFSKIKEKVNQLFLLAKGTKKEKI